jgi:predicted ATPase
MQLFVGLGIKPLMTSQLSNTSGLLANRYRVLQQLGEGAMGVVWLVEDTTNGRIVALKQISLTFGVDDASVLKFRQEFRLMCQIRHPHCCRVFDYGQLASGSPFYTMEFIPGYRIDELGVIPEAGVRHILGQLLLALTYLHQMKLVHRDIKSANVKVVPGDRGSVYGTVKLMDFGLMDFAGRSDLPISGTVGYIAPEIAKRGVIDQRADLYALGCLVYEMLTGALPFTRSSPMELIKAHVSESPPKPSLLCPNLSSELESVVLRLLAKEPHERFQNAMEVMDALSMERPSGYGGTLLASPMVGRELELMRLFDGLGNVMCGETGVHFHIMGPVGIGKSRLVNEFRTAMQLENIPCVACQCREANAAPFAPLRELIQNVVPLIHDLSDEFLRGRIAHLATWVPELGLGDGVTMPPGQDKGKLIEAVHALLALLAQRQPFIVVCEDWHLMEPISRDVFEGIFAACESLPVLWITTARLARNSDSRPNAPHLHLPLHQLTETECTKLIRFALGEVSLDECFIAQMLSLSDGLPFYIERLLEHLVQEGLLVRVNGKWNTENCAFATEMPRDVNGLIAKKLVGLNQDAIVLARLASVMGGSLDLELLQKLTTFDENRLFDALGQLQAQRVLIQSAHGHYEFAQDLFRQVLYESFSITERQRTHGVVADLLAQRLHAAGHTTSYFEMTCAIADHYILACLQDQIIDYGLAAAKQSIVVFALDVAMRYLDAVRILLHTPQDLKQFERKAEFLGETARIQKLKGDILQALGSFKEALTAALSSENKDAILHSRAALAEVCMELGLFEEAEAQSEAMLNLIDASTQRALFARCLLMRCSVRQSQGRMQQAQKDVEEALDIARTLDDQAMLAESLTLSGHLCVTTIPRNVKQGIAKMTEAVQLLKKLGHHQALMTTQNFLGFACYRSGAYPEALASFEQSLFLSEQLHQGEESLTSMLNQSLALLELGRINDSLALANQAQSMAARSGIELLQGLAASFAALGMAWLGLLAEAEAASKIAKTIQMTCADRFILALLMEFRMEYLNVMGQYEEARRLGLSLLMHLKETGNVEPESHIHVLLAVAAARTGDFDKARLSLNKALEDQGAGHIRLKALAAGVWSQVRQGHLEAAEKELDVALDLAQQGSADRTLAELYGLKGEIELKLGRKNANETFVKMLSLAKRMSIPAFVTQALFGLAASKPYDERAAKLVLEAQTQSRAMLNRLEPASATAWCAPLERARVLEGNHIEFSLQKTEKKPSSTGPLRGIGFSSGSW